MADVVLPAVFHGVPMSEPTTAAVQRARVATLHLRTAVLPPLRDVGSIADARAVAAEAAGGRFARVLSGLGFAEEMAA